MNQNLVAAFAGLIHHINQEAEGPAAAVHQKTDGVAVGPWALHGRQRIMQMNTLIQRRIAVR